MELSRQGKELEREVRADSVCDRPCSLFSLTLEWNYLLPNLLNKATVPHQKRNHPFLPWNSLVQANSIFPWEALIWKSMLFKQQVRLCMLISGQNPWRRLEILPQLA